MKCSNARKARRLECQRMDHENGCTTFRLKKPLKVYFENCCCYLGLKTTVIVWVILVAACGFIYLICGSMSALPPAEQLECK